MIDKERERAISLKHDLNKIIKNYYDNAAMLDGDGEAMLDMQAEYFSLIVSRIKGNGLSCQRKKLKEILGD